MSGGPGHFVRFGMTMLSARKPGFLQDPDGLDPAVGPDLVIPLIPEAIVHGRVLSSSSEPVSGMSVQLFKRDVQEGTRRWQPSLGTQTNSNGEYRFAELLPGEYKVMTQELLDTDPETLAPGSQVYGFPPACFPGVPDFASGTTITLSMGQRSRADIPLSRQAYYRVALPVLNLESGGINITVLAQAHPGPGYSLGYNPGTHRIEGLLPDGTYVVQAAAFAPAQMSGQVTFTIAGREVTSPSMALAPLGSIPIEVHEEFIQEWENRAKWSDGKHTFELRGPRSYLQIWLEPVDDFLQLGRPSLRPPMSGPNEPLVIENVPPGAYWVHFQTSRGYVQSISSHGTDLLHQPLVVVSSGAAPLEITMRDDTAEISGSVSDLNPVATATNQRKFRAPAYIYCVPLPDSAGIFQEFFAMADGKIQSMPMAPGSYRVLAFSHQKRNLPYRDAIAMRAYENQGQVINLVPGQTEHLQLRLSNMD